LIKFIQDIQDEPVGGKAKGLQTLRKIGLNVPDAFVLIHPRKEFLDDTILQQHLEALGKGNKAVRSSAVSEDGFKTSFAGQFETFLNLGTYSEIKNAIIRCIDGAKTGRVQSYSGYLNKEADLRISIILQNMVEAQVAGVVFSANPVNNRRDTIIINAVQGHGEGIVSGMKDAFHYSVYRSGKNIPQLLHQHSQKDSVSNDNALLTASQLYEILEGTKKAEAYHGMPVDLEWAIDHAGILHWLQVRPITTLQDVHFNELDTVKGNSNDIWTLGNIGEMMPGVATPLTYSVTAEAIDYGMVVLTDKIGAFKLKNRTAPRYIQMFYNRLFINMTNLMDYPKRIWLNRTEDVQFAICGKVFPISETKPDLVLPLRVLNFMRQMISTFSAKKHLENLIKLESNFRIDTSGDLQQIYTNLGKAQLGLGTGFGHHLMTSAQSGTLYSAFMRIMTGNKRRPSDREHHVATMLLLNIPEIESADAVKSLEHFADLIRQDNEFAERFLSADPPDALKMIQQESSSEIASFFKAFLTRHGHRCVREAELREKTWEEEPKLLIQSLQTRVRKGKTDHSGIDLHKVTGKVMAHLPVVKRIILRSVMPLARKAVAHREITKAYSIKMVNTVRKGYRFLAKQMVEAELLDDVDQIYFLTYDEIGRLLNDHDPKWKTKVCMRRDLFPGLNELVFDEVSYGIPEPLDQGVDLEIQEGQLKGIPVSSGVVVGRARIIHTLADAEKLSDGEIMVASFTDIGWTPYFSIISGLITEIGSPLSHGAVVAREYGVPAVVGVKGARRCFRNGDLIRLDGEKGTVEKIEQ